MFCRREAMEKILIKTLVAAAILLNAVFAAAVWWAPTGVSLDGLQPYGVYAHAVPHR
jgi:hypothetical protein